MEDKYELDELIAEESPCNAENLFTMLEATIDDIFSSDLPSEICEKMRDRILERIKEEINWKN